MGLLDRVSESGLVKEKDQPAPAAQDIKIEKKSNSVGLLKKSLDIASNADRLDFFNFVKKYNLSICAIFSCENGIYCIEKSAGLDGESICLSLSTQDFWNGISDEDTNDILPFYQFFSKKLKDSIKNLHLIKSDNGKIILFTSDSPVSDEIYGDLRILKDDFYKTENTPINEASPDTYCYMIDYSEAVESLVLTLTKSDEKKRLMSAIFKQIYFNLLKNFPEPCNVYHIQEGTFKIAYKSEQEIPFEVISNHLRLESEFVLENHSELIAIEPLFEAE